MEGIRIERLPIFLNKAFVFGAYNIVQLYYLKAVFLTYRLKSIQKYVAAPFIILGILQDWPWEATQFGNRKRPWHLIARSWRGQDKIDSASIDRQLTRNVRNIGFHWL